MARGVQGEAHRLAFRFYILFAPLIYLLFALLTPPFQTPDEQQHLYRAYQLSTLQLFGERSGTMSGGHLPPGLSVAAAKELRTVQLHDRKQVHASSWAEHFTRATEAGANRWFKVSDYGRTLSGMKAWGPVDAPAATPGRDSPCLEYRMYLFTAGEAGVTAITAPTLNFIPDRGVRYAVSFDDEPPQVVTLVPPGYQAQNRNRDWEKSVGDNAHYGRSQHRILAPG